MAAPVRLPRSLPLSKAKLIFHNLEAVMQEMRQSRFMCLKQLSGWSCINPDSGRRGRIHG